MLDKLVTIKLDKERHLRFAMRGMVEFDNRTGRNALKGLNLKDLSLEDTGLLLWCCLLHEDPTLELDSVLNMVDLSNLLEIVEAITTCLNQSLNSAKGAEKSPLPKRPRSQRG